MSYDNARSLMRKSVSRPTLFEVDIPPLNNSVNDYLKLFCINASVPEVSYETAVVLGQSAMGVYREQPSAVKFGRPLTITVIENTDFAIYKQFRALYDKIAEGSNPSPSGSQNQRMKYYNKYVFDMTLSKLEYPDLSVKKKENGNVVLRQSKKYKTVEKFIFRSAYVTRIQQLRFNTEVQNTYTSFSVDFNFETYSTSNSVGSLVDNSGGKSNLTTILSSFGIL